MSSQGHDDNATEGNHNAQDREQAAARGHKFAGLSVNQRRNQRSYNQSDADSHADAEGHAEIAHSETVAHIADTPHAAKSFEHDRKVKRPVESAHIGQQDGADAGSEAQTQEKMPARAHKSRSSASLC